MGPVVTKNVNRAETFGKEGSDKGDYKCQMNLVSLYKTDEYGKLDYPKAVYYCELASQSGHKGATDFLPVLKLAQRRFCKPDNDISKTRNGFFTRIKKIFD